jgi:hypothetical protein
MKSEGVRLRLELVLLELDVELLVVALLTGLEAIVLML